MTTIEKGFTIKQPPHGYVRLIDWMGSDLRIVETARISYKSPSKGEEADKKLLFYLYRNRHTSPLESCSITFNIKLPIFLMRQFVRHRTFRLNEWSGRYSELADEFFVPEGWREQDTKNKQGSTGSFNPVVSDVADLGVTLTEAYQMQLESAYQFYKKMLELGVAKEMARFVLPVAIYTEIYVNCDLHNLLHFMRLREDPHAQKEMRDVAMAMKEIASSLFPWTMEAYHRYQFNVVDTET